MIGLYGSLADLEIRLLMLNDYFLEIAPPSGRDDVLKFWESMFCLIEAVMYKVETPSNE
jgi:hypothetical protein